MNSLLSFQEQYPHLRFFISPKIGNRDSIASLLPSLSTKEKSWTEIGWKAGDVYFLEREEFRFAATIKRKEPFCFLIGFQKIPEEYQDYIFCADLDKSQGIFDLFQFFDKVTQSFLMHKDIEKSYAKGEEAFKKASAYQKDQLNHQLFDDVAIKLMNDFLDKHESLVNAASLEKFSKKIQSFFKPYKIFKSIEFLKLEEVNWQECRENINLTPYPLVFMNMPSFVMVERLGEADGLYQLGMTLLLDLFERYLFFYGDEDVKGAQTSIWDEAFAKIPVATAMVSEAGEVLLHNPSFAKLGILPNQFSSLQSGEKIEAKGRLFQIVKLPIDEETLKGSLFLFRSEDDFDSPSEERQLRSISNQDLGIITSSIAHELNNPLAGILAAINYLELEDWNEESHQALMEMKESAKRSKDLVEIFLGFSRARAGESKIGSLKQAFSQAMELLRFRMIEANIRLEVDIQNSKNEFQKEVNLSVMAMVFYLILGEVLTSFNHLKLIEESFENQNTLCGHLKQESDYLILSFADSLELADAVGTSKLINYLVDNQGLSMEISPGKIKFEEWKLV